MEAEREGDNEERRVAWAERERERESEREGEEEFIGYASTSHVCNIIVARVTLPVFEGGWLLVVA